MIRMYHPEHGWTHAYGSIERERLEAQGWKVEEESIEAEEPQPDSVVVEIKRRGRPRKAA